ncbi:hypothetical protein [Sphingobium abikonense]|uniref:hypothetical protein n=1 Tax=Sphingobium abikonense TaxID=86193 RepID=UPI000787DA88|nr:hypothetical protein [Sphingobium abikonense]
MPARTHSQEPETSAPTYALRGRFVASQPFPVAADLVDRGPPAPEYETGWPRWFSSAAFTLISMATLFAMCAMGRAGA